MLTFSASVAQIGTRRTYDIYRHNLAGVGRAFCGPAVPFQHWTLQMNGPSEFQTATITNLLTTLSEAMLLLKREQEKVSVAKKALKAVWLSKPEEGTSIAQDCLEKLKRL